MPIISALKRLSQEDGHKFRVKLGYIVRPFSKNNKNKITKNKEQNNMMKDILTYLIVKHV